MTILWVNRREWKLSGPIINMTVHNAWSFAAQGHETHLCLAEGARSDTTADLRDFYGLTAPEGLQVHRIRAPRLPGLGGGVAVYQHAARLALRLARRDKVAVFTRDSSFLPWLDLLQAHPRIRGFYELHDFNSNLDWQSERLRTHHFRDLALERLFLPRLAGLICITREQERIYRQVYPRSRTLTRPLGTKPMPPQDAGRKRRQRTLFYVGHMHGRKGAGFLEHAAVELARRGVRTEFWGGYEKDAARILEAARSRGLGEWLHAVAFRPPAELHAALAERASLGVVMLADNFYNRYLTCPVKALDYLSHGLPALGTDLPSVREVLGDAGHYLDEGDSDGFVAAALRLLDSEEGYAEAVARTHRRAAEITWCERARALAGFASGAFAEGER